MYSADFFQINVFKKIFQEYHHSVTVKQIGSISGPTFVVPVLGPNCKDYQQTNKQWQVELIQGNSKILLQNNPLESVLQEIPYL